MKATEWIKAFAKQLLNRSFRALGLIDPNSIQNLLEKNHQQTEEQQQQKNLPLWQYRKEDLHIWYQNETKRLCLDHRFKPSCWVTEKMMKLVTLWEVIITSFSAFTVNGHGTWTLIVGPPLATLTLTFKVAMLAHCLLTLTTKTFNPMPPV